MGRMMIEEDKTLLPVLHNSVLHTQATPEAPPKEADPQVIAPGKLPISHVLS